MSDDFDDLQDDDLFTNPASLAAIEQAVVSAEQNARSEAQGSARGRNGTATATANTGRFGTVVGGGRYHHTVAPAGSVNLRGRGGNHHSSDGGNRTAAPGMGMRPRPVGTTTPLITSNPQPFAPRTVPQPPVHHLSREAAPVPVQPVEDEDEEEYGPEFSVDDFGNYFESEVKDVRRQGLEESGLLTTNTGNEGLGSIVADPAVGGRKGMTRSPSVTALNPTTTTTTSTTYASQTSAPPGQDPTTTSHRPFLPKPFKRVNSQGETARRQAIQGVLSASGGSQAHAGLSQGSRAAGTGSQLGGVRASVSLQNGGSGAKPLGARATGERPSVVAGIGNAEIEDLRRQVELMAKEKKEIQEKADRAMQDLWRYQGEAKNVRMKADDEKKHAESKFTDLQKQLADLEEVLKSERQGHKRALDTVQTDHAFKMHNEQSSHVKPRFGTSQRVRTAHQMQSTPSRPHREGISASQQAGSQFPVVDAYEYTPSRSPTKKGGVPAGRARQGSMGPPPVPDLAAGFMTPKPLTASSRKARTLEGKNKTTPTNSKFRGLQDTFVGDTQAESQKKRKTRMDVDDGGRGSPTPSVFDHEQEVPDFEMQGEAFPLEREESDQEEYIEIIQEDVIVEVNHIIFTHFYTPIWESANESMKTVQRILTSHPDTSHDSFPLFQEKCSLFLEACGNREASPLDFCRDVNHALWDLLNVMVGGEQSVSPGTVVSIMQLLTLLRVRVPQFAAVFSLAAMDMPRNLFELLISQYWPSPEPTLVGGKSAASAPSGSSGTDEQSTLTWAHRRELGYAMCAVLTGVHSEDGEAPPCLATLASSSEGIRSLISFQSPISVVVDALDLLSLMSCDPELFRPLLSVKPERNSQEAVDVKRPPMLDSLCGHLKQDHPEASVPTGAMICQRVLSIICNLCRVHDDGLTLLGNSFHLVPSLVQLAETLANHIWGICAKVEETELHFSVLVGVVTVLHMLIFPPESDSQSTPSVHLRSVIARALESPKEYNGLHHVFITALGRISYAPVTDMKEWSRIQVTTLRYLAQDLLSELVGGNQREDDAIFAMYVFSENEEALQEDKRDTEGGQKGDDGPNAEEEAESKAMMDIIEID